MYNLKQLLYKCWNSPTLMTWGNMLSSSAKLLVLTPLILNRFDVDEIAFWFLLLTINSLMGVIDFGFYPTFSRIIAYAYNGMDSIRDISEASNDKKDGKPNWLFMQRIYSTLNVTYFLMAFLVLFIVLLTTSSSISVIIDRTNEQELLWVSYFIFILSIVVSFLARRSDAIIVGTNHVALINRWNIINNVATSISSIVIVYFDYGIFWLALNQLLFALLLLVRNYFIEFNICNEKFKDFNTFRFDKEIFKWVWKPTWQSGLLILASTGITQITGIIYSNMSSSLQLASYLITLKLVTTVGQFSQAPFYSKLPLFSGLRVNGNLKKLVGLTSSSIKKSLYVFVIGISGIFFFGDFLLELVNSNSTLESPPFLVLMAIVWFLERHHSMHAQIYSTTNKISYYKSSILCGLINVGLIYILVPYIGVWSFPVSQGLSNLMINNWWNVKLSLSSINENFFKYYRRSALMPSFLLIFLCTICLIFYYY